jgi:hypothetical protein
MAENRAELRWPGRATPPSPQQPDLNNHSTFGEKTWRSPTFDDDTAQPSLREVNCREAAAAGSSVEYGIGFGDESVAGVLCGAAVCERVDQRRHSQACGRQAVVKGLPPGSLSGGP